MLAQPRTTAPPLGMPHSQGAQSRSPRMVSEAQAAAYGAMYGNAAASLVSGLGLMQRSVVAVPVDGQVLQQQQMSQQQQRIAQQMLEAVSEHQRASLSSWQQVEQQQHHDQRQQGEVQGWGRASQVSLAPAASHAGAASGAVSAAGAGAWSARGPPGSSSGWAPGAPDPRASWTFQGPSPSPEAVSQWVQGSGAGWGPVGSGAEVQGPGQGLQDLFMSFTSPVVNIANMLVRTGPSEVGGGWGRGRGMQALRWEWMRSNVVPAAPCSSSCVNLLTRCLSSCHHAAALLTCMCVFGCHVCRLVAMRAARGASLAPLRCGPLQA